MQLVIRKGLDAPLPQRTDADTVLPCGASDRRLAAACQWPMADCLTGHHVACALLGDFEPLPGATFLAIAAAAVFRIAKERPERTEPRSSNVALICTIICSQLECPPAVSAA